MKKIITLIAFSALCIQSADITAMQKSPQSPVSSTPGGVKILSWVGPFFAEIGPLITAREWKKAGQVIAKYKMQVGIAGAVIFSIIGAAIYRLSRSEGKGPQIRKITLAQLESTLKEEGHGWGIFDQQLFERIAEWQSYDSINYVLELIEKDPQSIALPVLKAALHNARWHQNQGKPNAKNIIDRLEAILKPRTFLYQPAPGTPLPAPIKPDPMQLQKPPPPLRVPGMVPPKPQTRPDIPTAVERGMMKELPEQKIKREEYRQLLQEQMESSLEELD